MTEQEHLLSCLVEECCEVSQRATKALRFGLEEKQPGQGFTNAARICGEFADLIGTYQLLVEKGYLPSPSTGQVELKKEKISEFLIYSRKCGTLE